MDVQKTMEFILEQLAHTATHLGTVAVRVEEIAAFQAKTDKPLARAIRLAIREARRERKRRAELDDRITQLASAQLVTEDKLQRLIDSQLRTNGKG